MKGQRNEAIREEREDPGFRLFLGAPGLSSARSFFRYPIAKLTSTVARSSVTCVTGKFRELARKRRAAHRKFSLTRTDARETLGSRGQRGDDCSILASAISRVDSRAPTDDIFDE